GSPSSVTTVSSRTSGAPGSSPRSSTSSRTPRAASRELSRRGHDCGPPRREAGRRCVRGCPGRACSAQRGDGRIVVRFGGDLVDELGVEDLAVGVEHHDRAGAAAGERAVLHGDAVVGGAAAAEGGAGGDVLVTLGCAVVGRGEWQIGGYVHYGRVGLVLVHFDGLVHTV